MDYGQIPGVKNNVLFKPGAAKIINFLHLRPEVQLLHTVFDPESKAISYTVKVTLVNEDGLAVTEAFGAANTLEPKFAKAGMGSQNLVVSQAVKGLRELREKLNRITTETTITNSLNFRTTSPRLIAKVRRGPYF